MVCVLSSFVAFCWGSDESDNCLAVMQGKARGREVKEREKNPFSYLGLAME